jgi:ABC-2 type transport system permease protein
MNSLFLKEISSFFHSLTGYIVIIIFLLLNGLLLWVFDTDMNILEGGYASLDSLFILAPWVFLMLIPAITMRSLAEERRSGTLDLLRTRPLTELRVVLAKYGAALAVIILALLPTLVYYVTVSSLGSPAGNLDKGGTWGSYAGLLFLAAGYAAIGIFCSSLTDNLIVAFLLAAVFCLTLFQGFGQIGKLLTGGKAGSFAESLGISEHYSSMSRGVIDSRDVVYFLALIAIFIALTVYRLKTEKR